MQHAKRIEEDIFADVIEKIQFLTTSQQKFLHEMLFRYKKVSIASKKKLLEKSFGIWSGRKEIKDSIEYIDKMRKEWEVCFERMKG